MRRALISGLILAAAAAFLLGCATTPAEKEPPPAQLVCADRAALLSAIEEGYGETTAAFGLSDNGEVFENLAAPDGKTWSLLVTTPEGSSCLIAAGMAWRNQAPPRAGAEI
jgi:hypothetical protein